MHDHRGSAMLKATIGETGRVFSENPYVFIVGHPRSGTTLLRRMVDAHPAIAITPETHWILRYFESRTGITPDGFITPELIPALIAHKKFPHLQISQKELENLVTSREQVPYSSFNTRIFDLYGERQGKRLVGDKCPAY